MTLLALGIGAGVVGLLQKRDSVRLDPTDPKSLGKTVDKLVNPANNPDSKKPRPPRSSAGMWKAIPRLRMSMTCAKMSFWARRRSGWNSRFSQGKMSWNCGLRATSTRITVKADENQEPPVVKLEPVKVEKTPSRRKDRGKSRRHGKSSRRLRQAARPDDTWPA